MELAGVGLSDDDCALQQMVRQLVADEIAPRAAEIDRESRFPTEAMAALGEVGLLGLLVPEDRGGSGGTKLQYVIVVEEIAKACGASALTYMTQAHGTVPILIAGDDGQKQRWLPSLCDGSTIGAIALSEPEAGSDLASLRTRATREGDAYVLDGQKMFITSGDIAGAICVFARTGEAGPRGISAFIVDGDSKGLTAGKPLEKMGMRGSHTVELAFEAVRLAADQRLGDEGTGFATAMRTLDLARLSTAAQAIGLAQGALDRALVYAQSREQFGKPIYDFQAVQFRIVDMHIRIEQARALLHRVAKLFDAEPDGRHSRATAIAKVACSDVAMTVTTDAVQTLGGYGYITEYEVERLMRDAKVTQIYDGTNDINRLVIGRELGGGN